MSRDEQQERKWQYTVLRVCLRVLLEPVAFSVRKKQLPRRFASTPGLPDILSRPPSYVPVEPGGIGRLNEVS